MKLPRLLNLIPVLFLLPPTGTASAAPLRAPLGEKGTQEMAAVDSRIDFSYAFAPPHRMTVARPDSSDKTLLDLEPGVLRIVWSYDNLLNLPFGAFVTPPAVWSVKVGPQVDGASLHAEHLGPR